MNTRASWRKLALLTAVWDQYFHDTESFTDDPDLTAQIMYLIGAILKDEMVTVYQSHELLTYLDNVPTLKAQVMSYLDFADLEKA